MDDAAQSLKQLRIKSGSVKRLAQVITLKFAFGWQASALLRALDQLSCESASRRSCFKARSERACSSCNLLSPEIVS